MVKALLLLADGAEEMEAAIAADVMRRGGLEVTIAGLNGCDPVTCSRQLVVIPDKKLSCAMKCGPYDIVVLPGGAGGACKLSEDENVRKLLKNQEKKGGFIAAICAGPLALQAHGIGKGKKVTSHPTVKDKLKDFYKYSEERVVVDDKLITSRGPGTSFEFALAIVEQLVGADTAEEMVEPMLINMP